MIDVLIIGAGPIGLACGIECEKIGLSYVIIDKGCLVNSIYNYPKNMTFFSTSDRLEIGDVPFVSHNPKPTRSEALEYYRRVAQSWGLNLSLYERVIEINPSAESQKVKTEKKIYTAKSIILATGFYDLPYMLNVPGEHLPKVKHYYDEPHSYFGMNIVVVGAANSAIDVALETYRKGAKKVTMIVREEEISQSVKYWVRPDIINRIEEGSIDVFYNSAISAIRENEIDFMTPEGSKTIENDFLLAMTGYQPDFKFLQSIGIKLLNDEYHTPIYNQQTMESNVSNVYLAGVICGGLKTNKWFIENSREHALTIINHLSKKTHV